MNNDIRKEEKDYNYDELLQLQEHARKYNYETDKKEFLKKVNPQEQRIILLSSQNPYEVLNYLDEIDLEESRYMLNQLTQEEILKMLDLFSTEDKKMFYATFSQTSLVNRFIALDKKATNHISNLELDRKIELLDSSNLSTVEASYKVYESISPDDRLEVIESITTLDGSVALNSIEDDVNDLSQIQDISYENSETKSDKPLEEKIDPEKIEQKELNEKSLEEIQHIEIMNQFFKLNIQYYMEKFPELKNLDVSDENLYQSVSPELKLIIDNDFMKLQEKLKEQNSDKNINEEEKMVEASNINLDPSALDLFQQAKLDREKLDIDEIKNIVEENTLEEDSVKTM